MTQKQNKNQVMLSIANYFRIIPEICLAVILFIIEIFIIYLFVGFNSTQWNKYGTNMVSGISMGACYMVFTYQSPFWLHIYAKHNTILNFLVFNAICFPLGFAMYFFDDFVIRFFTNSDYVEGSVCFHSQMVFFTLGINTTYFNGKLIKGSSFATALMWYVISWLIVVPFCLYITKNTNFGDPSYSNEYMIVGSLLCSIIFTNLTKLSIFSEFDFTQLFPTDTTIYMCISALFIAGVQYALFFVVSKRFLFNTPHTFMAQTTWNMLTYTWVSQIIIGRTIAHDLFVSLVKNKKYSKLYTLLFVLITFGLSYALVPLLVLIYQQFVFKQIMVKIMGSPDYGAVSRFDFAFNFGAGNLMLVLNGLTWFSKANQEKLIVDLHEERHKTSDQQEKQLPVMIAQFVEVVDDSEVDFAERR
ncbi:Transmembrane_domain-containing protein [Hexamita inflata]|uniref:Transmembrane domain-containing protein n=1 Tax=Hexamita inflata TaxID=28002 RepID=A0AA86P342_9EUKA|nr:Transmembrane domain-containing protein [Hexamita inflata]